MCGATGAWPEDTEIHSKASRGGSPCNQDAAQSQGSAGEEASSHENPFWRLQEEDGGGAVQTAEAHASSCKICQDHGSEGKHPQQELPGHQEALWNV